MAAGWGGGWSEIWGGGSGRGSGRRLEGRWTSLQDLRTTKQVQKPDKNPSIPPCRLLGLPIPNTFSIKSPRFLAAATI